MSPFFFFPFVIFLPPFFLFCRCEAACGFFPLPLLKYLSFSLINFFLFYRCFFVISLLEIPPPPPLWRRTSVLPSPPYCSIHCLPVNVIAAVSPQKTPRLLSFASLLDDGLHHGRPFNRGSCNPGAPTDCNDRPPPPTSPPLMFFRLFPPLARRSPCSTLSCFDGILSFCSLTWALW